MRPDVLRAAAVLSATVASALCAAPVATARWSAPERLSGCAAALSSQAAPLIVFPSSAPQLRSGPGALLWSAPRACGARVRGTAGSGGTAGFGDTSSPQAMASAATAGAGEAFGATLATDDLPGGGRPLANGAGGLAGIAAATGTAAGQVVVAGASAGEGALAEGRTPGAFVAQPLGGPAAPVALSSSYLGDTVLASLVRTRGAGWAIAVRVQRHYSSEFAAPRLVPAGAGPVEAVAAAMDYRADILLVWAARGGVYARELPAGGAAGPAHRLGSAGSEPEIGALVSDDGHAIVAWRSQSAAPGGSTRTTIELSLCEASFSAALTSRPALRVERFRDPPGFPPPPGSLRLIRLSSEAVMMAWTGIGAGRYVVRASPVSLRRGAWAPVAISGTLARDAVLADLVPGPHAEALALWSTAPRLPAGGPNPRRRAIVAAKGHYAGHGEVAFEAPEAVAPPGPNGTPAAAFDPRSGSALAAWVTLAGGVGVGHIAYALRAAGPASAPPPASAGAQDARRGAGGWVAPAVAALGLLLLASAGALLFGTARRPGRMRARRGS
jgi:hypothetical protein